MPARRLLLHALIGPALAGLPAALAWAPGMPTVDPGFGAPVSFDASTPTARGSTQRVALASGDGHVVAAVGAADGRTTQLVELGVGKPARPIHTFARGATHPTVGTNAAGRVVVLVRTCEAVQAGKGIRCGIEVTDLETGTTAPLPGSAGARIAAMDRGAVVLADDSRLRLTASPAADGSPGRTTSLPPLSPARSDTALGTVEGLDLRDGVVAAVFELKADFGGSQLARYDAQRGWSTLGASTNGGAALGSRAYYTPTVTPTGVRAFFDGAEDFPGFAGRWSTVTKPVKEVRAAPLGNPVHLTSAAFLGDRLLVFTWDDSCDLDDCRVASYGPFAVG